MGLTKERKIFIGLGVVALAALIADQGVFGTQGANADTLAVETLPINDLSADIPAVAEKLPAAKVLIDRLGSIPNAETSDSLGAVFSLTKLIEPQEDGEELASSDTPSESFALIPPTAQDLPLLSAVMPSNHGGGAVLGGKILRIGQVDADGYRLIHVHRRSVVVERDGVEYTIEIPRKIGN